MDKLFYVSLLLLLGISLSAESVRGQASTSGQHTIKGMVTDSADDQPLPGVNIILKGTTTGTSTDQNGEYSLEISSLTDTLMVSFIGYQTQEVAINGRTTINITLQTQAIAGEELVVVGYGEQTQEDLTGSISQVSGEELTQKNVVNVGQALEGQVAGAQVIQQSGGRPGGNPMIRIRGNNSINTSGDPLFVVDGIVGVDNALTSLNPNSIVSMEVLKDASATAIYGARGANGVIIITTSRGEAGRTQVEYNGSISLGRLQRHLYSLDADQLMYIYMQSMSNGSKYGTIDRNKDYRVGHATGDTFSEMPHLFKQVSEGEYFLDLQGRDGNYYAPRYNSNWEDKIFNPALSNSHNLEIRGGDQTAQFSLSLGYINEEGLMDESWLRRYNGRITGDIKVFEWLDLSSQITVNRSKNTEDGGVTRPTTEVWPIVPTRYPNNPDIYGNYAGRWGTNADFPVGEQWFNPKFIRDQEVGYDNTNQVTGSINFEAALTDNLSFQTNFAFDYNSISNTFYGGKYYSDPGEATINTIKNTYWQNENYFNYENTFRGDHNIHALLGLSWSQNIWQDFDGEGSGFINNFYKWNNIEAGAQRPSITSDTGESSLNSYFARLHYDYKSKYLLTLTGRLDGSSKFGPNSKYGFFPSAGLAWNIASERFIRNNDALSHLISTFKVRGSVGITGNQEIGSYVTQSYVGANSILRGTSNIIGLSPISLGNPNLKWEETTQYDVGLDLGLWNSRFNFTADYYVKQTNDMLLNVPLPHSTSTGEVLQNFGSVENKGWEFTLNTQNISQSNFSWNTTITAYTNKNTITELGPTGEPIYIQTGAGNATTVFMEGEAIGSFFGLNRLGTWNTDEVSEAARYGLKPGDLKYEDKNNDGSIDFITDGGIIGNGFPDWTIGIDNSFYYNNFDANLSIIIVEGVDKGFILESAEDRQLVSGGLNSQLTAWRPDSQDAMVAQVRPGNAGAYYQTYADTRVIQDASYIRGAGATLGYTISDEMLNIGIQDVRVYVKAKNFFLNTEARGYNAVGSSIDKVDPLAPNSDKYAYPRPAVYTFGVDINF